MFAKSHSDAGLKEFIVFGRLRLMHDGKLGYVCTDEYPQIKEDVEEVFAIHGIYPLIFPLRALYVLVAENHLRLRT